MRLLVTILIFSCILFALLVIGANFYVNHGQQIIQQALKESLKREVKIGAIHYQFPLGLRAEDVSVDNVLQAKAVDLQFNPHSIVSQNVEIAYLSIWQPVITINKGMIKKDEPVKEERVPQKNVRNRSQKQKGSQFKIKIDKVMVLKGETRYINHNSEGQSLSRRIKKLFLNLGNIQITAGPITFPLRSLQMPFQFQGQLPQAKGPFSGSRVEGAGWIDIIKKDMQGGLKILDTQQKAQITADFVAKDNDMHVEGNINARDIFPSSEGKSDPSSVESLFLGSLSSMGLQIDTRFSFDTKMDDFQLTTVSFSGNVVTPELSSTAF